MTTIQNYLIEQLGLDKARTIVGADGPAGSVNFEKEDERAHPYQDYKVERSFNDGAVLLIQDDTARRIWRAQQEVDPRAAEPQPKLRLMINPNRKTEHESDPDPVNLDMG